MLCPLTSASFLVEYVAFICQILLSEIKATHPKCCSVFTKWSLHHIPVDSCVLYNIVIHVLINISLLIIMSEFNNVKVTFFHDMLDAFSVTIALLACYVYLEPICTLMYCFLIIIRNRFCYSWIFKCCENERKVAKFWVLTAVWAKIQVFQEVMPCWLVGSE